MHKLPFLVITELFYIQASQKAEIDALQKESEMPIEELLKNLPPEILEKPASLDDKGNTESGDDADDEAEEKVSKFILIASAYDF